MVLRNIKVTKRKLSYASIILNCSERRISTAFAASKLFALSTLSIEASIAKDTTTRQSLLVCLKSSYLQKPHIYEQIAKNLDCNIATIHFGLNFNTTTNPLQGNPKKVYLWSDVQIKAKLFIRKFLKESQQYCVFQHGAFPHNTSVTTSAISMEWVGTEARDYYAWTESDRDKILAARPDLTVHVIGAPSEEQRKLIDGHGFATRGPEYMEQDTAYLFENSSRNIEYAIFFHPAYTHQKKKKFLNACKAKKISTLEGSSKEITASVITLSRSFLDVAQKSKVPLLITDQHLL